MSRNSDAFLQGTRPSEEEPVKQAADQIIAFPPIQQKEEAPEVLAQELAAYYKEVQRRLTCPVKERKQFLNHTRRVVADLLETCPDTTFADVESFLGHPQELAETYLASLSPATLQSWRKQKKILRLTAIACLATILVGWGAFTTYLIHIKSTAVVTMETTIYIQEVVPAEGPPPFPLPSRLPLRDRIGRNAALAPLEHLVQRKAGQSTPDDHSLF